MIAIKIDAREFARVPQVYTIAGKLAPGVIARTLNWVGDRAQTQVGRTLAKQTGLPYGQVKGALLIMHASPARLSYEISASSKRLPLSAFKARQQKKGVSAAPWGERRVFAHTFLGPGGRVFVREGKGRLPIRQLWGASIAIELVKDAVPKAFDDSIKANLDARLGHELLRLFPDAQAAAKG